LVFVFTIYPRGFGHHGAMVVGSIAQNPGWSFTELSGFDLGRDVAHVVVIFFKLWLR